MEITIPRMDSVAVVNSVQLARRVRELLKLTFEKVRYFTDLSAACGMLQKELGKFNEFCGSAGESGECQQQRRDQVILANR